jgi:thioredoxin
MGADVMSIELTDSDFKEKLVGQDGLVLFYKKICPHCKALKKVLEKFTAVEPDASVMQIDSEENPATMAEMTVSRIPTLLVVKSGEVVERKVGLMNVRDMVALYQDA